MASINAQKQRREGEALVMHDGGTYNSTNIDQSFVSMVKSWVGNPAQQLLGYVWVAYDDMRTNPPPIDTKDLERSITQLLEYRIRKAMSGFEPFYVQHGPFERETMKAPPAQPPEYDLAFVFLEDERVMWPLEAKVLKTPKTISKYNHDVQDEFLTCRYAPFVDSGAMLGYLLSGNPEDTLSEIAKKLPCDMKLVPEHINRPNTYSKHKRLVPSGKPYPENFVCYHLILEFPNLSRSS